MARLDAHEEQALAELEAWRAKMAKPPGPMDRAARNMQTAVNNLIPEQVHAAITKVIEGLTRTILTGSDLTGDFVYIRLHGDEVLYVRGYSDVAIGRWAERIAAWSEGGAPADARCIARDASERCAGRDVFCYFDNDAKVMAPRDAQALTRILESAGARIVGAGLQRETNAWIDNDASG